MSKVFEIGYRYVVPSIKREIVLELLRRRFSEIEVSKVLGVSKSLVSRYARGERGALLDVSNNPVVKDFIVRVAHLVESGEASTIEIEEEIVKVVVKLLSMKALCGLHVKIDGRFNPISCQICSRVFRQ